MLHLVHSQILVTVDDEIRNIRHECNLPQRRMLDERAAEIFRLFAVRVSHCRRKIRALREMIFEVAYGEIGKTCGDAMGRISRIDERPLSAHARADDDQWNVTIEFEISINRWNKLIHERTGSAVHPGPWPIVWQNNQGAVRRPFLLVVGRAALDSAAQAVKCDHDAGNFAVDEFVADPSDLPHFFFVHE